MSLEKAIKFYEKQLPRKNTKRIREYVKDCYEFMPEIFLKEKYSQFYLNLLMQEYLNLNQFKELK